MGLLHVERCHNDGTVLKNRYKVWTMRKCCLHAVERALTNRPLILLIIGEIIGTKSTIDYVLLTLHTPGENFKSVFL